jgi:hypothetical protein
MNTAAERLLGLSPEQIQELAKIFFFGQLRFGCHDDIEEINLIEINSWIIFLKTWILNCVDWFKTDQRKRY